MSYLTGPPKRRERSVRVSRALVVVRAPRCYLVPVGHAPAPERIRRQRPRTHAAAWEREIGGPFRPDRALRAGP